MWQIFDLYSEKNTETSSIAKLMLYFRQSRQWVSGSWVIGQDGSTNVNGSRGSRVSTVKHLTHD